MRETVLVGVDWGTTNLRAYAFAADGSVRTKTHRPTGITRMSGPYGDLLEELCRELGAGADTPALLCGMVGSRQGWIEARYITTPCTLDGLVEGLVSAPHAPRHVLVVPGLDSQSGSAPDVMRGEETQLLGLMESIGAGERLVCMPGTHCKWVQLAGGRILDFRSYMTGEAFAALKDHTILGRQMSEGAAHDAAAFARGVAMAQEARGRGPGALLNLLFGVRTLGLFDRNRRGRTGGQPQQCRDKTRTHAQTAPAHHAVPFAAAAALAIHCDVAGRPTMAATESPAPAAPAAAMLASSALVAFWITQSV